MKPLILSKFCKFSLKNCWTHEWFKKNWSIDGWGFKKTSQNQKYNRISSFWKTKFVFQNPDFLSENGKLLVFLKPWLKLKSHYIAVFLMKKKHDFLFKIRVFGWKLRHDCINFSWKTCFSHKNTRKCADIVFFVFGFKPKNGPM